MKQKKTKIIIGVLLALVMFASSVALLMYTKQNKLTQYVESHIEVYIAAKTLNKGDVINATDIKLSSLPKSYIGFTPLTKAEIVGRYANVDILATEPMRSEKISITKPEEKVVVSKKTSVEEKKIIKQLSSDTIAISLNVFKNLDSSLKKGDFIDIVSIKPKSSKKDNQEFSTKYIALHVAIDSFISNSKSIDKILVKEYDKNNKEVGFSMADSVVFEMSPKDIKNFLPMYYTTQLINSNRVHATKENKGHIWMVKCSKDIDEKAQKEKKRLMVDARKIRKAKKRVIKKERGVIISYEQ